MKRLLLLFSLCIVVLYARPADAQRAYFDGSFKSNSTFCPVTNNLVTVLQTYTGYFTDLNAFPQVGDLSYVHAVGVNVSPCVNDAVGFEFFLPVGASLAISATNPVYCFRGRIDGTFTENVPNSSNSACSQTSSTGLNGGLYFGYSALPPGWFLEVQVPVVFSQQLFGLAGPNSHRLTVASSSAYGTLFPFQPVTVFQAVAQQSLTVLKSGTGTVTSSPGGIDCGATCSASFSSGSSVTLTASPAVGWLFSGWTAGPCAGSNPMCTVAMNSAQSVTATFAIPPAARPDAFSFNAQTSVPLSSLRTSNSVAITGLVASAPISVTNGEYSQGCTATFVSTAGTISPGQSVCVRHTSAATAVTAVTTTLTIGGVAGTFTSTTAGSVPSVPTRLINLSTRGQVQTGDNVMIGGFIIGGASSKTVLIRAVGPNLANFGVPGVLANPTLQLFSGQTVIGSNDNWGSASNAAAIQATGLAPANSLESAILVTLAPGAYTAIVSGGGWGDRCGDYRSI